MICPVCGGQVVRVDTVSSGAGEVHYSGCCLISLELLDNFEVIEGLPEPYRQQAIADSRAVFAVWHKRNMEEAARFAATKARIDAVWGDLMKQARRDYAY